MGFSMFRKSDEGDLGKYIKYNVLGMRAMGLWSGSGNFFEGAIYWKYAVMVNLILVTYGLAQMIFLVQNLQDLDAVASSAFVSLTCCLAGAKGQFCMWNAPLFKDLFGSIRQEIFLPRNARQWRIVDSFMYKHVFVQVTYFLFAMLVMIPLWMVYPLFDGKERNLPFAAWYPYDSNRPVLFELSYLHQVLGGSVTALTHIMIDCITSGFIAYVGVECDLLSDTIRNINEFAGGQTMKDVDWEAVDWAEEEKRYRGVLLDCVEHHWKIIEFSHNCNKLFTFLVFFQFGSSFFAICMSNFQLTVLSPKATLFYVTLSYQIVMFLQLGLYCWFGNELIEKSSNIAYAVYDCPWMDTSTKFKKEILFFMHRSQLPIQMYALNFFILSLPTYTGILKASWSFFAMLRQVHIKAVKDIAL